MSSKNNIIKLILLFLLWRIFLFLIAFFSPSIIPKFGATFPYFEERLIASGLPHFIWSFGNFDGVHYLGIAKDSYAYQYTQAFFPFYPVLIRLVSFITFGNLLVSALLISNTAFLVGLFIFYKLVNNNFGEKVAWWSCLFLLIFPTSFYFGAVYTEGLFFLIVISVFYLAQFGRIWQASIVGALASGTRLVGLFLAPALLIPTKKINKLIPLLTVPLGFLLYVLYLKLKFNNPFYFLTSQAVWGQERSTTQIILLPQVFWRYLKILSTTGGLPFANALFELSTTLLAIILLIIALGKMKKEWLVFGWLAVLVPTLSGTLSSMPRYVLVAFPIFIVLGLIKNSTIKILIAIFFSVVLLIALTLFTQGYWVA